jgi:hypothetical protein
VHACSNLIGNNRSMFVGTELLKERSEKAVPCDSCVTDLGQLSGFDLPLWRMHALVKSLALDHLGTACRKNRFTGRSDDSFGNPQVGGGHVGGDSFQRPRDRMLASGTARPVRRELHTGLHLDYPSLPSP